MAFASLCTPAPSVTAVLLSPNLPFIVRYFGRLYPRMSTSSFRRASTASLRQGEEDAPSIRYGTKPNALVQFDYIDLGPSVTGEMYDLIARDDYSGYAWLYQASNTYSERHRMRCWAVVTTLIHLCV